MTPTEFLALPGEVRRFISWAHCAQDLRAVHCALKDFTGPCRSGNRSKEWDAARKAHPDIPQNAWRRSHTELYWCWIVDDAETARAAFLKAFDNPNNAFTFEKSVLSQDLYQLPACAAAVHEGEIPTAAYWRWLREQVK